MEDTNGMDVNKSDSCLVMALCHGCKSVIFEDGHVVPIMQIFVSEPTDILDIRAIEDEDMRDVVKDAVRVENSRRMRTFAETMGLPGDTRIWAACTKCRPVLQKFLVMETTVHTILIEAQDRESAIRKAASIGRYHWHTDSAVVTAVKGDQDEKVNW